MPSSRIRNAPESTGGAATSKWCAAIDLYGWDSLSRTWHGPNELGPSTAPNRRLLQALQTTPGKSWFGPVSCAATREAGCRFFVLVHDLADCAVALIYCDESKAGPVETLVVIPAHRRHRLREEFAFEFLTFARFLGTIPEGVELQVHDAIAAAVAEASDSKALAFSISSDLWPGDLAPELSNCVENIILTLCRWLGECVETGGRASRPI